MMRLSFAGLLSLLLTSAIAAQDVAIIELDDLLVSEKLPNGYESSVKDTKKDGKVVGKTIVVSKPNESSRITIQYQFKELPDVAARREATKVNFKEYSASLVKLGYKTVEKNIPDFDQETFEQPLSMSVLFFNDERKLWTHHEFFFTDKGFWVRATADNSNTLEDLKKWAKTVKPKTNLKSQEQIS